MVQKPEVNRSEKLAGTPARHLNQIELSRRWSISPRTLENWRWRNEGPVYLKIGGRVAYRLDDIEAFEAHQVHVPGQTSNE